jgi:hypothetical protein
MAAFPEVDEEHANGDRGSRNPTQKPWSGGDSIFGGVSDQLPSPVRGGA